MLRIGIDDLAAPAVADGEVHVQAALADGALLGRGERARERLGQASSRAADVLHAPVAVSARARRRARR